MAKKIAINVRWIRQKMSISLDEGVVVCRQMTGCEWHTCLLVGTARTPLLKCSVHSTHTCAPTITSTDWDYVTTSPINSDSTTLLPHFGTDFTTDQILSIRAQNRFLVLNRLQHSFYSKKFFEILNFVKSSCYIYFFQVKVLKI